MTDSMLFRPLAKLRSSDRIAEVIRQTILGGKFRAGDRLPTERSLAQRFQVTRNTVREALRQLEQLRMVAIRQGHGVVVQDFLATAGMDLLGILLGSATSDAAPDSKGKEADAPGLVRDVFEVRAVVGQAVCAHALGVYDTAALGGLGEAVEAFAALAERPAPDPRALLDLDFELHMRLIRGSGNVALVLLFNSLRHVCARVPRLLERLVADPRTMAARYREAVRALAAGDREAAKAAFAAVYEAQRPPPDRGGRRDGRGSR